VRNTSKRSTITAAVLAAIATIALAGCGSSAKTGSGSASTSLPISTPSSFDPDAQPNAIPYDVGDMIALPGGWRVEVVKVHRGYAAAALEAPRPGDDHVAVDVRVINDEGPNRRVQASLFTLYDASNRAHPVIAAAGTTNALDGTYAPGTDRTGRLVFEAPVHSQLRMILDGRALGSKPSVFQIDPPKVTPRD
jgi:Domain of unknown function (DUF4352)